MCPRCNGDIRPWGVCQCDEKRLKARIAELEKVAEAAKKDKAEIAKDAQYIAARCLKAESELSALREAQRWIPVDERLPSNSRAVLVYCPERLNTYCANYGDGCWTVFGGGPLSQLVTHWRPVWTAPEVEKALLGGGE